MKIKIYAETINGDRRIVDIVETDSPNRAIQMYDDEMNEDEVVVYEEISESSEKS